MVHIIMGPEGSGKTKRLIDAIHQALKDETGSMVCIEKGHTMRFDVDHRVRLIDAGEYALGSYTFLKGFISGLHAGNFDITHIPQLVQSVLAGEQRLLHLHDAG